jgi:pilus assembly protein CpaB
MNKRFIAVLVFAFVVASVASLLLYRLMSGRQPVKAAQTAVKVVLASRILEVGTLIKESDVKLADWSGPVPNGSSTRVQDVVGRGVTSPVYNEEPVLESRLAPKGAGGGLPSMIPSGMRAVAIRVNEVAGVAGFVVPGMRVDLIISGSAPGAANSARLGTLAKTMMQNIEVLSAGQEIKKDAEGKPMMVQVVNLLVTPDQAEQVSLAASQTQIQLILRNPLDRQVTKTPGAAMAHLFTGGKLNLQAEQPEREPGPPAKPRARPAPTVAAYRPPPVDIRPEPKRQHTLEILNGARRQETKFTVENQEKPE